ncbi:DMT family transporter [Streptomyces sp. NPDC006654]|uniref:DMT family transporter n=1 Tax=Streptomyces sp. NPDC006654 TaxID=3156897 RepID=UPI0034011787
MTNETGSCTRLLVLFWGVWLFQALSDGPAYLVLHVVSLSPVITVLMAVALLRERIGKLAVIGVVAALIAIMLISIPAGDHGSAGTGSWLLLSVLICVAWDAQAYFMRKAALADVNGATTFGWMTISGLLLEKHEETPEPQVPSAPPAGPWAPLSAGSDHARRTGPA